MKLAAIARRGIRRDFWDLYAILAARRSGLDLDGALQAYRRRFGVAQPDLYHVIRALTYFDDAERETVWPAGLTQQLWIEVKRFFTTAARDLLRR